MAKLTVPFSTLRNEIQSHFQLGELHSCFSTTTRVLILIIAVWTTTVLGRMTESLCVKYTEIVSVNGSMKQKRLETKTSSIKYFRQEETIAFHV